MAPRVLFALGDTMKTAHITYLIIALVLSIPGASFAGSKSPRMEKPRYRDADKNGVNELFRDGNGDGINDVSGKAYQHNFKFSDKDGDGKNDLFLDSNGDGVNDLVIGAQDKNGAGNRHTVIDFDGDGVNDITGKQYSSEKPSRGFIDEDGDGINDNAARENRVPGKEQNREKDIFTDEDGDGINDGRGFGRERRNKDIEKQGGRRRRGQK